MSEGYIMFKLVEKKELKGTTKAILLPEEDIEPGSVIMLNDDEIVYVEDNDRVKLFVLAGVYKREES